MLRFKFEINLFGLKLHFDTGAGIERNPKPEAKVAAAVAVVKEEE